MARATAATLGKKLARINMQFAKLGKPEWELDFASCYGGYELTLKDTANVIKHRVSGTKMFEYLDGVEQGIWGVTR